MYQNCAIAKTLMNRHLAKMSDIFIHMRLMSDNNNRIAFTTNAAQQHRSSVVSMKRMTHRTHAITTSSLAFL